VSALAAAATTLACVTAGAAGTPYAPGANCRTVEVDGRQREYVVYVPRRPAVTGAERPVVFMFHGSSGNGERFLKISGWREQADATGLVAVFPTGLRYRVLDSGRRVTKWNSFDLAAQLAPGETPADDVGFTDAMLADLEAQLPVDTRRVYASGFSNGAEFAARLAVERSTVFAAAAYSAGALYTPAAPPARAIPMYLTVGSRDDRVLAQTGRAELPLAPLRLLRVRPIATIVDAHLATLGLARRPFGALSRRGSTTLSWRTFRFSVLEGLGHHYPNGNRRSAGFRAAPVFWRFFRGHPLPPA
jgi:polyhydroxybutyrate depolymerase